MGITTHKSGLFTVVVREIEAASIRHADEVVRCENNGGVFDSVQMCQDFAPDGGLEYFDTRVCTNSFSVAVERSAMVDEVYKKLVGIGRRRNDVHAVQR